MKYLKSSRLDNVCYDIRGPILEAAEDLEKQGHRILKLNIGNPSAFGLLAPDEIFVDLIANLRNADGYSISRGIYPARKAIYQDWQSRGFHQLDIDHIWLGNGVSELITLTTGAFLNPGDEVLVPSPDYPLWTAAVSLTGATAVHYRCSEEDNWAPDLNHIESLMNEHTKGIVIINPNNPTGAIYANSTLERIAELARKHKLVVFADEIYDRILFDKNSHTPMATYADNFLCLSFNGLSKSHRIAGFRAGWLVATGATDEAKDLIAGIDMLCSMRLCSNVPAQLTIQTALGGYQSLDRLIAPNGRLTRQRDYAFSRLNDIQGVSCTQPNAALYLYFKVDLSRFRLSHDDELAQKFLEEEHVLIVPGSAFNHDSKCHFRIVFLPNLDDLEEALSRFSNFLERYRIH